MEKVYEYENAIIRVRSVNDYNRENLKKVTEEFLKKVISEGKKNGNCNTSGNL